MTTPPTDRRAAWPLAIPIEVLAYGVIILTALAVRAAKLGTAPLSTFEARQALAVLQLVRPEPVPGGAVESPLVFAGALVLIALFGTTNAAVRALPMLGGVGLVLAPLLFRRRIGRFPALVASAWLAISPAAVAASRRATGAGLGMLALLLGLAAADAYLVWRRRASVLLVGVMLGTALLADYGVLVSVLAVSAGWVFAFATDEEEILTRDALRATTAGLPWSIFAAGLAGAVALLGTLFLIVPNGLGLAADQITRFAAGFAARVPGATSPALALAIYDPALVVFGFVGAWLASQSASPWQRALAGWGVAAGLACLIYPGALPEHALWAVVPLAGLAGIALRGMLSMQHEAPTWGIWAQAASLVALAAMLFASLTHHLKAPRLLTIPIDAPLGLGGLNVPLDLILASLWAILLVVQWLSSASLWGPRAAWLGTGTGVLILGSLVAAGQSGALAFTRAASPYEPANIAPSQPGLDWLVRTAEEVGELGVGYATDASVTAQATSALVWALRDFHKARFVEQVDPSVDSVMVVTYAGDASPALGSNYVGQDFVIIQSWTPRGLKLADAIRWIIYRTAPTQPEELRVILWVREDICRLSAAEAQ